VIGLTLIGFLGFGLFVCFLIMGIRCSPRTTPDSLVVSAVHRIVGLEGLSFAHFELLLEDSDYRMLRSLPALLGTAKQFRKDRGELAILWIGLLLKDLKNLWRFRRFLVRRGAPAGFTEEVKIGCTFVFSFFLLHALTFLIRCWGPFALPGATRQAKRMVETMCYAPARVLRRIPETGWAEIAQSWARSAA
jgi:uncharacterized protein YjeT (DUF2065 family)